MPRKPSESALRAARVELARLGGLTKSPRRSEASRRNGKLSTAGRPVTDLPRELAAEIRTRYPGAANKYLRDKLRAQYRATGVVEWPAPLLSAIEDGEAGGQR